MAVDPVTGAAIIGAGATLLGGIMGDKSAAEAAEKNVAGQERFAKEGIKWKVADAKAAGILPEYALGASTHSFQPTYTGGQTGSMVADAGQNIARAALASSTQADRDLDHKLKAETLRGMILQNNKIQGAESQMSRVNTPGNPPFPHLRGNVIEGQGNSPVKDVPLERTGQDSKSRYSEGASIPSVGWAETADGGLMPVPSTDIKNRIEDQAIPETAWAFENMIKPNFQAGARPPTSALPKGYGSWVYSPFRQAWYPKKLKKQTFKNNPIHPKYPIFIDQD